jgi:hypothetical protein
MCHSRTIRVATCPCSSALPPAPKPTLDARNEIQARHRLSNAATIARDWNMAGLPQGKAYKGVSPRACTREAKLLSATSATQPRRPRPGRLRQLLDRLDRVKLTSNQEIFTVKPLTIANYHRCKFQQLSRKSRNIAVHDNLKGANTVNQKPSQPPVTASPAPESQRTEMKTRRT